MTIQSSLKAILVLIWFGATFTIGQEVNIRIKSDSIGVTSSDVLISDVAEVTSSDRALVERVQALDLDMFDSTKRNLELEINRNQVLLRSRLAGIPSSKINVTGPDICVVKFVPIQAINKRLAKFLVDELAKQFGLQVDSLSLQILNPDIASKLHPHSFEGLSVLFPLQLPLGNSSINVSVAEPDKTPFNLQLNCRITLTKEVLISKRSIQKGEVFKETDFQIVERQLDNVRAWPVNLVDCLGKSASRAIQQHEAITSEHVAKVAARPAGQKLVRQNDLVDAVLVEGPVTIRLKSAKALSSGNVGESIRIRNMDTNKIFTAVVQDKTTVLVR